MKEIFENIGSPKNQNFLNFNYGSNSDIINSLNKALPQAYKEVKLIAPYFKGRTPQETSYKIWYFLKNKIAYIKDRAGYQFVKLPRRMLDEKSADCKSKSLFTAAVLKQIYPEAKIYLRYASYSNINIPTHVYCVMILNNKTYLIDSVYKAFNEEKQFNYKNDYEMKIYTLSGFDEETINGRKERKAKRQERRETRQEKRQERRETRQEKRQQRKEDRKSGKKPGALKKVALAAPRAAFLGILALNVKGLATKLNRAISINPAKVQELWTKKLGGEFEQLKKVAEKGSTRKMIGYIPDYEKEDYNLGQRSILGEPVSTATAVATAAPVILAIVTLLKQILPKKDYEESGNTKDIEDMSKKAPGADAGEDAGEDSGADAEGGFFAKNKILIFGGAAALALFFIMKKK